MFVKKAKFHYDINEQLKRSIIMIEIYTDGASRQNPGKSGAGIIIKADGETFRYVVPLGEMTNHEAEFYAVIYALKLCQEHFPERILSFRTDAKVVVDAVEKNYTGNPTFQPLLEKITELSKPFPYVFMKWIPDKENHRADQLAKRAIDAPKLMNV